jgi:DNA-binding NarL/FixJ family response regulator
MIALQDKRQVMPRQKCRILLVDDYVPIRKAVRGLLTHEDDFEVVGEAEDGKEAIDLVAACHPDVVLLDINMSKINGVEAARLIKRSWASTVVLGLSINRDAYVLDAFLRAGGVAVIPKESIDELVPTVRRACPEKTKPLASGETS